MVDILFVQDYYEQNIGMMYISSVLKQHGFTTDVIIGSGKYITGQAIARKPRIIGFYCTTGFHHKNIAAAAGIKRSMGDGIITLLGGPHPTFAPEVIKEAGVDIVCRGEGEYAVLELLRALREGKDYTRVRNLTVKKNGIIYDNELRPLCDVSDLPHPDRELYRNIGHIYGNKRQEVMLGRGCSFSCAFCSNHAYMELYEGKGVYARYRPVSDVMEELISIKRRFAPSCIVFHDDMFISDKDYIAGFLRQYKEKINLPYACLVRADLMTDACASLLKESGCYFVSFGIESGNAEFRNRLLNKCLTEESIVTCAGLLHKYQIPFSTFNMVGLPGETLTDVMQTGDLNARIKPVWAWFSVYQPLPATKLARFALNNGYINTIDVDLRDATFHEQGTILRKNPEGARILRLKNNVNLMIKFPFLRGAVNKIIISLPFDGLYAFTDGVLSLFFYYSRLVYGQSIKEVMRSLWLLFKNLGAKRR